MSFAAFPFAAGPFAAFGPGAATSAATGPGPRTASAPKIVNGDTVRDADGNLVDADDPIDEEVAFFIATRAGSFFGDPQIGNGVFRVRVRTDASIVTIRDVVTRALAPMIERGDIADVDVSPRPEVHNGIAWNFYDVTYRKTGFVRR